MQLSAEKKRKLAVFILFFLFFLCRKFFSQEQAFLFVNDLKINGFTVLFLDSSVNFQTPTFRYNNFVQPE